jgi:pimeloyl-ACP methyl ester carboxylesterase
VAAPPAWFLRALATPFQDHFVEVDGCPIHYLAWGDPTRPGVVLIHGGSAHAHWWSFIAPLLIPQYYAVALDLSGHGDSGRRPGYPMEQWAEEVMAVARDARITGAPILIGHSMGGVCAILTAATYGDRLAGAIIVDTPLAQPAPEAQDAARPSGSFRRKKIYPDRETAMAHFRLVPPQPCEHPYILEHIARTSVAPADGGWSWKFDYQIFERKRAPRIADYLARVRCRVAVLHGELSDLVTPDVAEDIYEVLGRNAPVVAVPQAYHHVLLDQPLAFVTALRTLLADWEHTVPRRRP